jgi:hypothetical protein
MLLLGTIVGVFINAVSPNWLITVCLIIVLSFTVYRTALKAKQVILLLSFKSSISLRSCSFQHVFFSVLP